MKELEVSRKYHNKITSFLFPILGISYGYVKQLGFINLYLADSNRPNLPKEHVLYMLLKPEKLSPAFETALEEIRKHPMYTLEYDPEPGKVMLLFEIQGQEDREIYNNIVQGQYSKVNKDYVETNFAQKYLAGRTAAGDLMWEAAYNYRIFNKDSSLKEYWENKFSIPEQGVIYKLDDEAEVWSKPIYEEEIY